MNTLRELLAQVEQSSTLIDSLNLHMERLRGQLSAEAQEVVAVDIAALRAAAARVSELGSSDEHLKDFARKLGQPLSVLEPRAAPSWPLRAIGTWRGTKRRKL